MYWHVEFQTPRYRAYREKCRQKGSKDEKWPDRVEEAFQYAIRKYRRQGRKKKDLNGKQSGGNEFISEYILKRTGERRDRKQVSSHIQVLKGFLGENKAWMSLVADIKPERSGKKAQRSTVYEEAASGYEDSEYDDASEYQPLQASYPPYSNRPPETIEILACNVYPGPTIRQVSEFKMILEDRDERVLHTYTSIQSEMAAATKALEDVNDWRENYPPLAAYSDKGQIDCPMFLFDTHLSLMDHCYGPSRLAIAFSIDFSQGAHFRDWRSHSRYYEENGRLLDHAESRLQGCSQIKGTTDTRLGRVPLNSEWWARVFTDILMIKQNVEGRRDADLIRKEDEKAGQYIRGISVMQEIWATHQTHNDQPKRMAILLWKFGTARRGEAATTSWRRLHPPRSPYQIQEPPPSPQQPPMTLDTALRRVPTYAEEYIAQPSIFSADPSGNLVRAPLSEDSSPSATPTPESRSFPSSTSTSFPSSASNSANPAYPIYPPLESLSHSQDSLYPPLGSFDSQSSAYCQYEHQEMVEASQEESFGPHEFAVDSQESYGSQEVVYHSQDSFYQHAPDPLYGYLQHLDVPSGTASTSQDFTGGQIHLSYDQTENSPSSYEAPLIAPQANMIPQHQLIQHPEHFDQHDYLDQDLGEIGENHPEIDEQSHAQPLLQPYELNGLTMDFNSWEETLRLNPDLERHLGISALDEVRHMGQEYMSPVGQKAVESAQGEVLGEVQDEEDVALDRHLEYQ